MQEGRWGLAVVWALGVERTNNWVPVLNRRWKHAHKTTVMCIEVGKLRRKVARAEIEGANASERRDARLIDTSKIRVW